MCTLHVLMSICTRTDPAYTNVPSYTTLFSYTSGNCISSCTGLSDGDYQSCLGCHVYASCSNERLYDNRPCPAGLVWDDHLKRCEWVSTTCSDGSEDGSHGQDEQDGRFFWSYFVIFALITFFWECSLVGSANKTYACIRKFLSTPW